MATTVLVVKLLGSSNRLPRRSRCTFKEATEELKILMNDKQQFKMMMSILINNDARVAYHTYSLQEGKKKSTSTMKNFV